MRYLAGSVKGCVEGLAAIVYRRGWMRRALKALNSATLRKHSGRLLDIADSSDALMQGTAKITLDALGAGGIAPVLGVADHMGNCQILVPAHEYAQARRLIRSLCHHVPHLRYTLKHRACKLSLAETGAPGHTLTATLSHRHLVIYYSITSAGGRMLYSEGCGCVIYFADESIIHDLARTLSEQGQRTEMRQHCDRPELRRDGSKKNPGLPQIFNVIPARRFEIDFVYTWAGGEGRLDEMNTASRVNASSSCQTWACDLSPSRIRDRGELRYSLRSISMYARFFRKVFIVVSDNPPKWLNADHPQLEVVRHHDLFAEPSALPTFNSHAIETQLHRIPNLSEHFLYFNDDFFVCRHVCAHNFFTADGIPKIFPSNFVRIPDGPVTAADSFADCAAKNNRALLYARFGQVVTQKFLHVPFALTRSTLAEICETFPDEITCTMKHRFRATGDYSLTSSLFQHYSLIQNRAQEEAITSRYVGLDKETYFFKLLRSQRLVPDKRPQVLCINEIDTDSMDQNTIGCEVVQFLDDLYPVRAEFELAGES